jgi:NAD(P)-dependent dehydrogenase (short-subunit alcohol dehydrogenase family)
MEERNMGLLDGKVAVITGAGSGMGKASARIFAQEGARLVLADISGGEAQTASEIGGRDAIARQCDVGKEDEVVALIQAAVSTYGRLDAILNVAGIGEGGLLENFEEAQLDRIYGINFKGVFFGSKHAIRAMKNNGGGTILNWASLAGLVPSHGAGGYGSMKAGVIHLTKSVAAEYGHANIRANALCPGTIITEGMGAASAGKTPDKQLRNPLGRAGTAADAGELAAFLASDKASYISGVAIPLDGGWSCKMG